MNDHNRALKISVIIPYYNKAEFLDEALTSVYLQSYADWECLIVNDGSQDDITIAIQKWLNKDKRFQYYEKKNGGVSSARNFGIKLAKGEWILPLDPDDRIGKDYLELASGYFGKGYSLIYCEAEKFGDEQGKWQLPDFSLNSLAEDNVIFNAAFYKKSAWTTLGGYDESLPILEDWDFWISLLKNGDKVARINKVCFYYRIKSSNSIMKDTKRKIWQSCFKKIILKHKTFFSTYLKTDNKTITDLHQWLLMSKTQQLSLRLKNRIRNLFKNK